MTGLTHVGADGAANMVDVSEKAETMRTAVAEGIVTMQAETLQAILAGDAKKGDVLGTARIAGIMAAKRTHELVPLCHPLLLTKVSVDIEADESLPGLRVTALARVTGKTGAGRAEPPRHHVMPKEFREWFEKRGFTGKMRIDWFCVTLQQAHHQAIHGGGNWKLGRTWPGEWNRMTMEALFGAEAKAGRMLTRNTILEIVAKQMKRYRISMNFIRCGGG